MDAEAALSGWVSMGLIAEKQRDAKSHLKGYAVAVGAIDALAAAEGMPDVCRDEGGVFD